MTIANSIEKEDNIMLHNLQDHVLVHAQTPVEVHSQILNIIHSVFFYLPFVFLALIAWGILTAVIAGRIVFFIRL